MKGQEQDRQSGGRKSKKRAIKAERGRTTKRRRPTEEAGEKAGKEIATGLFLSPIINELMASPKESLALSVSENIFKKWDLNCEKIG